MKKIWLLMLAALLMVSCSDDQEQGTDVRQEPLYLEDVTRAPSETIIDADEEHSPIHFFLMSGTAKTEGDFIYNSGWTSTIGIKEPQNYIYGFSPATAAAGKISTVSSGATDYSGGAVLTLTDFSAVSGDDICVLVGVKASDNSTAVTSPFGTFDCVTTTNNHVSLLLDHLFTAIDFRLKIGSKYNELRDIYLKKMELKSSLSVSKVEVRLTANTNGDNPMTVSYTTDATTSQTNTIYDYGTDATTTTGLKLLPEGTSFVSYCAPLADIYDKLTLVCTYDVYNKKGTRVRENCVAENSLSGMTGLTMERRKKNTVNLTVEPTYLYQLSEDELDNPTVVLGN